mmetsp:Transcript_49064/g.98359  ORF Transcript_49064/g.98359 Transcript_49064/m.98359 type:complete len:257 (-) Transcript_49064:200-970(-)
MPHESHRFLGDHSAPKHPHDRSTLEQGKVERDLGNLARRKAYHHVAPVPCSGTQTDFAGGPPDRIKYDVNAAWSHLFERCLKVLVFVVDYHLCPLLPADLQLAIVRCSRDDFGTERLPQLNRRQSDASARPQHKQGLCWLESGEVGEGVIRGAVHHKKRCSLRERHARRLQHSVAGRHHHLLREAPPRSDTNHLIPDLDILDAFSDLRDNPRDLRSRREFAFRLELILSLNDEDVRKVRCSCLHVDDNFSLLWLKR